MVPVLQNLLPDSQVSSKSTGDFIDNIKCLKINSDFIMASLDDVKLFPSINICEVCTDLCNIIDHQDVYSSRVWTTLKQTLNLIVNNNYFMFNSVLYKQNDGAPMGYLISGLLAEFKMRCLQEVILNSDNSLLIWLLCWWCVADVPFDYKLANFRYFIIRASTVCSDADELNAEL